MSGGKRSSHGMILVWISMCLDRNVDVNGTGPRGLETDVPMGPPSSLTPVQDTVIGQGETGRPS